ncbi:hypothetical protein GKZ89_04935 [Bacillus mangrovi]|uniref:Flagellar hook-length control protein-like C-terminal domain-containing protein n=1 Tax=Metabacillus mangrovi TaxID=1491830 RepID=A0A7X2S4P5_9BACI|nr:hypothetical protein [Metabacillus mangrovi]
MILPLQSISAGLSADVPSVHESGGQTGFYGLLESLNASENGSKINPILKHQSKSQPINADNLLALFENLQVKLSGLHEQENADPELLAELEQVEAGLFSLLINQPGSAAGKALVSSSFIPPRQLETVKLANSSGQTFMENIELLEKPEHNLKSLNILEKELAKLSNKTSQGDHLLAETNSISPDADDQSAIRLGEIINTINYLVFRLSGLLSDPLIPANLDSNPANLLDPSVHLSSEKDLEISYGTEQGVDFIKGLNQRLPIMMTSPSPGQGISTHNQTAEQIIENLPESSHQILAGKTQLTSNLTELLGLDSIENLKPDVWLGELESKDASIGSKQMAQLLIKTSNEESLRNTAKSFLQNSLDIAASTGKNVNLAANLQHEASLRSSLSAPAKKGLDASASLISQLEAQAANVLPRSFIRNMVQTQAGSPANLPSDLGFTGPVLKDLPLVNTMENNSEKIAGNTISSTKEELLGLQLQSPLSKPEHLSLFLKMNPEGNGVRQEYLMEQLQKLMASSRFTAVNGSEKLFLKLYPEHLGELRIEIMQSDGKWTAKFTAVNAHIKEAIESNLHQLKQGLNQQSLHIDKIEVFQSHSHPGRELPQEQSGRQREQHQQSRRDEAGRTDFEDSLSEEIANLTE